MKQKFLNGLAIVTSLFGYLEWGGGNSMFLYQGEYEVIGKLITDPVSAAHPFTVLPLLGQSLLLVTLFQKEPGRWLTYFGVACVGLLLIFMFLIGLLSLNYKFVFSTLPFVMTAVFAIIETGKRRAL